MTANEAAKRAAAVIAEHSDLGADELAVLLDALCELARTEGSLAGGREALAAVGAQMAIVKAAAS